MIGMRTTALALGLAVALAQSAFSQSRGCTDPMAVLKAFYQSNDEQRYDASMKYLREDITFDTWATGVNGYIMAARHLKGKAALRRFLGEARGLRHRLPGSAADGPVYHETRITVDGADVKFMLEPDRKRPDGRLYNPFSIEAVVDGCRIKSLTVIENITWL